MHNIFAACWYQGTFPDIWKRANITPISKTSKPSSNPKHYRPIALLSCLGKLFEKVIAKELMNTLKDNDFISPEQAGFQPGRDCVEQLFKITEDIIGAFQSPPC